MGSLFLTTKRTKDTKDEYFELRNSNFELFLRELRGLRGKICFYSIGCGFAALVTLRLFWMTVYQRQLCSS